VIALIGRSAIRIVLCVSLQSWLATCVFSLPAAGADTISDGQWYVTDLALSAAHRYATGNGVVVAVVDSGVDASHPALNGAVIPGADFTKSDVVSNGDGRSDVDGHGTAMAGLIVGHGQIQGVAPSARVLPIRVGEEGGRTNFATGIRWAVDHGANIVNISSGSPLGDPRELSSINYALDRDVVVVASVGNVPDSVAVDYPARYPGVVAVGATNKERKHAGVSVVGPEVLLTAPGEKISSARLHHGYAIATGTSDSTALVSGVAALVRSLFPKMPAREVIQRLTSTAIDLGPRGRDDQFGFGLVDPVAALTATVSPGPDTTVATVSPSKQAVSSPSPSGQGPTRGVALAGGVLLLLVLVAIGLLILLVATRRNTG
jgi:type VII secretion-associated serine protease mycosin